MFLKHVVQSGSLKTNFLLGDKYYQKVWSRFLTQSVSAAKLKDIYAAAKTTCSSKKLPRDVNPNGVFACNELDLREITVYGFDYDYTLACYKPSMDLLLFNLGKEALVKKFTYPKDILELSYNPDFTIRGLHYDIEKGLFMKLDSFLQIQLGTVYRGRTPVPDEKVIELYKNKVIPIAYVEAKEKFGSPNLCCHSPDEFFSFPSSAEAFVEELCQGTGGFSKLYQLADLFSRPEMGLLCCITDYFESNRIDYHPEILFRDVRSAIGSIHPVMHNEVMKNTRKYLEENPEIRELLMKLRNDNKKLFLITNSPYQFVNTGLNLIVGEDWIDFFDIVIVQARKPKFFTDESRPIRVYDKNLNTQLWDRVTKLEKGVIYCEGTIKQLKEITGWLGGEVLYFGDHPYSDLADATLEHGWRTGAIIHELTHEIATLNNPAFKMDSNWLQVLTQLIEEYVDFTKDEESAEEIKRWVEERNYLLQTTKDVFNPQFGSVFRTYNNPTYFSRRLFRFADIYTSNLANLLRYSLNHTFFPRRGALPHEYASLFM